MSPTKSSSKVPKLFVFAEFLRLRLLPTAWSNILAAYLLGGGSSILKGGFLLLLSSSLYLLGMGLNDLVDRKRDETLHPSRPLPSKRLSFREALFLCLFLNFFAAFLSVFLLERFLWISLTYGAILLYNFLFKHIAWLAPLGMSLCRTFHYGIGLQQWSFLLLYIFGYTLWLTWLSLCEKELFERRKCYSYLAFLTGFSCFPVLGLYGIPLSLFGFFLTLQVSRSQSSQEVETVVKKALLGFPLLDATLLVWHFSSPYFGLWALFSVLPFFQSRR